jgi:hypothetical protein
VRSGAAAAGGLEAAAGGEEVEAGKRMEETEDAEAL